MSTNQDMVKRLRDLFQEDGRVAQTNFRKLLAEIPFSTAIKKAGNPNSIALLTFHVGYYVEGVLDVLNGKPLTIRDAFSFNMPDIADENDWHQMIEQFLANAEALANLVEKQADSFLESPFAGGEYGNWEQNLNVLIEHGYYHLGQMALIRKWLTENGEL